MEELPTASQARELSYESAIKRLDRYVNEAIAHGKTRRDFDFDEFIDDGLLIIENIDKVAQHFKDQHYQVEYGRNDYESGYYQQKYNKKEHPIKHFLGLKEHRVRYVKACWMNVKW